MVTQWDLVGFDEIDPPVNMPKKTWEKAPKVSWVNHSELSMGQAGYH